MNVFGCVGVDVYMVNTTYPKNVMMWPLQMQRDIHLRRSTNKRFANWVSWRSDNTDEWLLNAAVFL